MVHEVNACSKRGGQRTLQIYGKEYYKKIGKLGGESVKRRKWFHDLSRKRNPAGFLVKKTSDKVFFKNKVKVKK